MSVLTIAEAAATTGWSPRMLRYLEQVGLVAPKRSEGGFRLYGPAQVERLRSLKDLVTSYDIGPAEIAFAARMRTQPALGRAVQDWLSSGPVRIEPAHPARPAESPDADWLRFEQEKHERLLTSHLSAAQPAATRSTTTRSTTTRPTTTRSTNGRTPNNPREPHA